MAPSRRFTGAETNTPDTLYVSGGDVTVRRQGDLMKVALYYGGTQRANLKLATFTTREVTALGG